MERKLEIKTTKYGETPCPKNCKIRWILWTIILLAFYPISFYITWVSDSDVDALLEIWASATAFIAAFAILIHFLSLGISFFLVVSLGFFMQGFSDFFHAILYFPRVLGSIAPNESLISLSYVLGRFLLVACLTLAPFLGRKIERNRRKIFIMFFIGFSFIFNALIFFLIKNYHTTLSEYQNIGKILNLFIAFLFFINIFIYISIFRKGNRALSPFFCNLIMSLIFGSFSQIYFFSSKILYDFQFDFAHLLKILSYIFPIWGVGVGIIFMYRKEKDVKEKLSTLSEELKKALSIQSKFTFLASHELRVPLAAMKEGTAIILDGSLGEVNEKQKEFLTIIKNNIDRLILLVNDILNFQRMETGKIRYKETSVDVNNVIEEVSKSFQFLLEKEGLSISLSLQKDLPQITIDKGKLQEVLYNLVENGRKFTEKGGITISSKKDNGNIVISVKDTGKGIKKEDLEKLFQSFAQIGDGSSKQKGLGLGLVISKHIVEHYGGKMWVDSVFGQGTTFYFSIPINR